MSPKGFPYQLFAPGLLRYDVREGEAEEGDGEGEGEEADYEHIIRDDVKFDHPRTHHHALHFHPGPNIYILLPSSFCFAYSLIPSHICIADVEHERVSGEVDTRTMRVLRTYL